MTASSSCSNPSRPFADCAKSRSSSRRTRSASVRCRWNASASFVTRRESGTIHEAPCTPAQAVLELLGNSLNITSNREREIAFLAQLVSRVPAVQISYPSAEAAAATVHTGAVTHLRRLIAQRLVGA